MAQKPDLLKSPHIVNDDNNIRIKSFKHCNSTASSHQGCSLRLCAVNLSNLENRMLDWDKNVYLRAGRNVVYKYDVKSRPESTQRGTPIGWLSTNSEHGDMVKILQNQIVLPAPDGQVSPKRGLSGSKIRKSSATSGSGRRTSRNSFISDLSQELSVQPSHNSLPLKFRPRLSNRVLMDDEGEVMSNYKWNSSNQALRLQHVLTRLNSLHTMKRASEVGSYRIDPMYCLLGSRLSLMNRYGTGGEEMVRTHDLMSARERTSLNMKKMKLKSESRAPEHRLKTEYTNTEYRNTNLARGSIDKKTAKKNPRIHIQQKIPMIHTQQENPVVHTQQENSVMQTQQQNPVTQTKQENSLKHAQQENNLVIHTQHENNPEIHTQQDNNPVVHTQQDNFMKHAHQDINPVMHTQQENNPLIHTQQENSKKHAQQENNPVIHTQQQNPMIHVQQQTPLKPHSAVESNDAHPARE